MPERGLLTDDERTVLQTEQHAVRPEVIEAIEHRITEGLSRDLTVLETHAPETFDHLIGVVDEHLVWRYRAGPRKLHRSAELE